MDYEPFLLLIRADEMIHLRAGNQPCPREELPPEIEEYLRQNPTRLPS
jgi:hypothetical protein